MSLLTSDCLGRRRKDQALGRDKPTASETKRGWKVERAHEQQGRDLLSALGQRVEHGDDLQAGIVSLTSHE
jgi:hypothetical protein